MSLTLANLQWAAGFLDGEGSFQAVKHRPQSGTGTHCVNAGQKQRWPLEKLQGLFGGAIYQDKKRTIYRWAATGPLARGLMMTLYPLMSPRRQEQIRKALSVPWMLPNKAKSLARKGIPVGAKKWPHEIGGVA